MLIIFSFIIACCLLASQCSSSSKCCNGSRVGYQAAADDGRKLFPNYAN